MAMSVATVTEIAGVASIIPFISLISGSDTVQSGMLHQLLDATFGIDLSQLDIYNLGAITALIIVISLFVRGTTMYLILKFTHNQIYDLSQRLFKRYLEKDYQWFLNSNTSHLSNNILTETEKLVNTGLVPIMMIISHGIAAAGLLLFMISISFSVTIATILVLGSVFIAAFLILKRGLFNAGEIRFAQNIKRFGIVRDSMMSIKTIKFEGIEGFFISLFKISSYTYSEALAKAVVLSHLPRYFIEAITICGIILISIYLVNVEGNFASASPILAAFALAGYKLLPSLQLIYINASQLKSSKVPLDVISEELTSELAIPELINDDTASLPLPINSLELKAVYFSYSNSKETIFKDFDFSMKAGETIAIIGKSGSGKSTLVNLILGLLKPDEGHLSVNNQSLHTEQLRAWRSQISYVPQSVFIANASIAENIALGINHNLIDMKAVQEAAEDAQIADFIQNDLSRQYDTIIGDGGAELSGGQQQRIGIARAFYKSSSLIVLDECTSALDIITENAIMENIVARHYSLGKIIVTHRLSSLKAATRIIVLKSGKIEDSGTFSELKKRSNLFNSMLAGNQHGV